ncbi:hypothetical protein JGL56_04315 [Salmonella enterica subsp. enterica serovar Derby]|nr:hypothetical protein [Salmonella enterica subsp. enterica serovar Derby]
MITMSTKMLTWFQGRDNGRGDMTGVLVQYTFANTPVVSPDNKKTRQAGVKVFSNCRFKSLPSWRSSAKHEWIV